MQCQYREASAPSTPQQSTFGFACCQCIITRPLYNGSAALDASHELQPCHLASFQTFAFPPGQLGCFQEEPFRANCRSLNFFVRLETSGHRVPIAACWIMSRRSDDDQYPLVRRGCGFKNRRWLSRLFCLDYLQNDIR